MSEPVKKCPQCNKDIETPVSHPITFRRRERGQVKVLTERKDFCSGQCAMHYQMSMEG